jgi:hypothetical protein
MRTMRVAYIERLDQALGAPCRSKWDATTAGRRPIVATSSTTSPPTSIQNRPEPSRSRPLTGRYRSYGVAERGASGAC